jgi:hypothetical protein
MARVILITTRDIDKCFAQFFEKGKKNTIISTQLERQFYRIENGQDTILSKVLELNGLPRELDSPKSYEENINFQNLLTEFCQNGYNSAILGYINFHPNNYAQLYQSECEFENEKKKEDLLNKIYILVKDPKASSDYSNHCGKIYHIYNSGSNHVFLANEFPYHETVIPVIDVNDKERKKLIPFKTSYIKAIIDDISNEIKGDLLDWVFINHDGDWVSKTPGNKIHHLGQINEGNEPDAQKDIEIIRKDDNIKEVFEKNENFIFIFQHSGHQIGEMILNNANDNFFKDLFKVWENNKKDLEEFLKKSVVIEQEDGKDKIFTVCDDKSWDYKKVFFEK